MQFSVIIPTLNRCDVLADALASVCTQSFPAEDYEIIVVDNGSTDGTRELIEQLNRDSGKPIRYIYEPQLGIHNARHAGARAAKGDILVFTDDDATFDPGWLQAYAKAFAEHSEMAAAGGPIRLVWEAPPPQWLLDFIGSARIFPLLGLMEPYNDFRLDANGFFFGGNMAIKRNVLFEVGGFNPEHFGDIILGDGESGLNRKLWERGMLIGYVPDAIVYHHIPPKKMTVEYLCRRQADGGAGDIYARFHHGIPHRLRLLRSAVGIVIRKSKYWIAAFLFRGRTDPRSLHIQLHAGNTQSHLKYILRLILDKNLRQLVLKEDWLNDPCA